MLHSKAEALLSIDGWAFLIEISTKSMISWASLWNLSIFFSSRKVLAWMPDFIVVPSQKIALEHLVFGSCSNLADCQFFCIFVLDKFVAVILPKNHLDKT